MQIPLKELYKKSQEHQKQHACGAVPYEQASLLTKLIQKNNAQYILEIGTGIGYTAACIARANSNATIYTIDKDYEHLLIAKQHWETYNVSSAITAFEGKAHEVISSLYKAYDIIFYDAYTPQKKFLVDFERLLPKHALLVTANLFLNNTTGGKYLRELHNTKKWQTTIVGDTAISVKLF